MPKLLDAVLIAGPTASGKSAFAIEVACATGGVILNADSMQVYRDLSVLTARPAPEEERQAEHRLYGFVDGAETFSVGRYADAAASAIRQCWAEGRLPIVTGGTGLYFQSLEQGLSRIPALPQAVRDEVRAASEGVVTADLHDRLARLDPAGAAGLRPSDRLRVMRALEVFTATGRSLSSFHGEREPGLLAGRRLLKLFLAPERAEVHERINRRFRLMIETGALGEARALAARGLDPMLPVMRAHGAPALMAHLRGEMSLNDAIQRGQADTRAYVKRQFTWFRNQMEGWRWIRDEEERAAVLKSIV
ncbi:MAG: tRNA (adenosine(37)-N6)-dimethylallyltransferase MiaA [Hyphomicrobiales bacterium]|nr:tRNA (adenosine(37)-N6)-dimethylallyltransferase MiaA [Hyphomicrobiales bacterium]